MHQTHRKRYAFIYLKLSRVPAASRVPTEDSDLEIIDGAYGGQFANYMKKEDSIIIFAFTFSQDVRRVLDNVERAYNRQPLLGPAVTQPLTETQRKRLNEEKEAREAKRRKEDQAELDSHRETISMYEEEIDELRSDAFALAKESLAEQALSKARDAFAEMREKAAGVADPTGDNAGEVETQLAALLEKFMEAQTAYGTAKKLRET